MTELCPKCGSEMKSYHDLHFEICPVENGVIKTPTMMSDCLECISCGHILWKNGLTVK